MNGNTDFDRMAQSWLQDGPTEMPDRSLQAALDEVHVTSQQRFGAARRTLPMNGNIWRIAAAAVIGLIVIVGGITFLGGRQGGVGGPPAATPSPSPSPTPSASPASPAMLEYAPQAACGPGGGALDCKAPGTYRLSGDVWPGEITMAVPAGWFEWLPYSDQQAYDALLVGPDGSGWGLEFNLVGAVAKDPCDAAKGTYDPAETGTVDGLVAAMSRWPGFESTAPAPTVVGGYSGQLVELTSTRTDTDCPNGSVWTIPGGGYINAYPMVGPQGHAARAGTFRIVDVNGTLFVIRTTDFPDTSPNELSDGIPDDPARHAAHQVAMQQILDSIAIEPGQSASPSP